MTGNREPGTDAYVVPLSVVSRSRLFREGVCALLAQHVDIALVEGYSRAAPDADSTLNPPGHVVLVDAGIGSDAIVAWTRHWRGLRPPALVIVIDLPNDMEVILACIRAGASGCTFHDASAVDVARAVSRVRGGAAYCSPEITTRLFKHLAESDPAPTSPPALLIPLSPRELEILRCIAGDLSNQQIAERLVLELCTVKHHVHNILEKLQLRTRWDAVRLAAERGWLEPAPSLSDARTRTV